MTAPSKLQPTREPGNPAFDPVRDTISIMAPADAWRLGKGSRKKVQPVPSVMMHWPSATEQKREIVRTWHSLAMAELHRAKLSFRLMAVLKDFVHWRNGMIYPTNATLAACAGGCSERIVSDLLGKYEDLGIVRLRFGWRQARNGKWLRTRIIFMTLPKARSVTNNMPKSMVEGDDQVHFRVEAGVLGDIEAGVLVTYEATSESLNGDDNDAA